RSAIECVAAASAAQWAAPPKLVPSIPLRRRLPCRHGSPLAQGRTIWGNQRSYYAATTLLHSSRPRSAGGHGSKSVPTDSCRQVSNSTFMLASFLRSEEHTSELQSHLKLVCRLLLAKKK